MKNNLLILVITILLVACESNKTSSSKENLKKLDTVKTKLTKYQKEKKLKEETDTEYLNELTKCYQSINAVTNFNGKKEFWRICESNDGKPQIIQIESYVKDKLNKEVYYLQNEELIYAIESTEVIPINSYSVYSWAYKFYTKEGKIISTTSLGHGKSDDKGWKPEIIFDMYKKRIAELNKIKN